MRDFGLSLEGALADVVRQVVADVLRAELAPMREDLAQLKRAAPPAFGDVDQVAALTGLSRATVRRRVADGSFRRAAGSRGRRVLIDLGSLRGPDDTTVAKLAREARGG